MVRVGFSLVLMLCLLVPVRAEDPVHFPDPALKEAVEYTLWVVDPTPTDMLGLTELVWWNLSEVERIEDLTGLEYALNLQTLDLRSHMIRDISALAGLSNLETLALARNRIEDVSVVSGFPSLQTLDLERNNVRDISPVSGLTNLRSLNLHRNEISDISPLAGLTSLTDLDLRLDPLNAEAYHVYIPIILANNPGILLRYNPYLPFCLSISSTAGGSVTAPGEGEFRCADNEAIYLKAKADSGFVFANWSGLDFANHDSASFVITEDCEIRACFLCLSEELYVDDDASGDSLENGTAAHPFDSIQEALEVAADGASILVRAGTYHENIDFSGKCVQLLGIDANEPNGVAYPVIHGVGDGPVVTFAGGEDPNCVLMGFVLTGGRGGPAGGVYCEASSPTIMNCLIVGNCATDSNGAAVYCTDSNAVFVNCTIADNAGGPEGSGLFLENGSVIVTNSILWGNSPSEILVAGVGTPSITYSDVAGGWPGPGNLDADPLFVRPGAWDDNGTPYDPADDFWIDGDYHLQSQAGRWDGQTQAWVRDGATSPCIDAGDPSGPVGNETVPNGDVINAGAYGGTAQASRTQGSF